MGTVRAPVFIAVPYPGWRLHFSGVEMTFSFRPQARGRIKNPLHFEVRHVSPALFSCSFSPLQGFKENHLNVGWNVLENSSKSDRKVILLRFVSASHATHANIRFHIES